MLVPIAVREVMVTDVETVATGETVAAVAARLREAGVGSLVVVEDGHPVGIVAESDVVGVVARRGDPDATTVAEVMASPLVSIEPDADVEAAAELLAEEEIKKLPVVEDGELRGILTTTDLSRYLPVYADRPVETERVAREVHSDTAYEREDWTFEYEAPPGNSEDTVEVGDVARFSKPLDEEDVRAFADATGDTNRLHLDEGFAAGTRFGRRIVHGALTTGVVSAALARMPGLTIYLATDLHFLGPVDVGDRVTAVCEVAENLGEGKYRISTTVEGEDGGEVVSGSATVLIDDLPSAEGERVDSGTAAGSGSD